MLMNSFKISFLFIVLLASTSVQAAKLISQCQLAENSKDVQVIQLNQKTSANDERLPLASVSKIFTTLFVLSKNAVNKKIYTQFFYTPVGNGYFDVHIKGSHDPYFNRTAMHWLIAKINAVGVLKIRTLSFDENFKYYHDTNKLSRMGRKILNPVSGKDEIDAPNPKVIQFLLSQKPQILKDYQLTNKEALDNGVQLPSQLIYSPLKIEFLPSEEFISKKNTMKGFVASPELKNMLKMMNWNSNNHAANQLFQYGGGAEEFRKFYSDKLGMSDSDLKFVNGSGQNAMVDGSGRLYNEATCSTVVRTLKGLKKTLELQNSKLEDVMSVVGGDIGSTVSGKTYKNPVSDLSVIAKTGTIGTNITLAGMASTQMGDHFFFFNVELAGTGGKGRGKAARMVQEQNRARTLISTKLQEMIRKLGGPKKIDYKIKSYNLDNFEDTVDDVASESEDKT